MHPVYDRQTQLTAITLSSYTITCQKWYPRQFAKSFVNPVILNDQSGRNKNQRISERLMILTTVTVSVYQRDLVYYKTDRKKYVKNT